MVEKIDKPIKITTYVNILDYMSFYGLPNNKISDMKQFEKYQRFLPNMEMDYVYYYDYPVHWNRIRKRFKKETDEELLVNFAKKTCIANRMDINDCLTPKQIKEIIDLQPEENRLVRAVEYDGKMAFLRMFDDMVKYPREGEITACLKNLTADIPTICFLTGHMEPSINKKGDRDYKSISNVNPSRGALINQGFRVKEITLDKEIPTDIAGLVLADPKLKYSPEDITKIKNYISKGGNIIIAGEPGKQSNINPIIEELGVKLSDGTILQESEDYDLDLVVAKYEETASKAGFYVNIENNITMPSVCGLEYSENNGFNIIPLLNCEKDKCWNRLGKIDLESGTEKFNPEKDKRTKATVALALSRNINDKQQKIVISGDADFMSNGELGRHNVKRQVNSGFAMRIFKWFTNEEYPISARIAPPLDNELKISRASIFGHKIFCLGIIPLGLLIFGLSLLIRRKRQ